MRPRGVLLTLGAFAFIALLTEGAMAHWSAVYLHDALGAPAGTAALSLGAFSLTMTVGRFCGDRLSSRLGYPQNRHLTPQVVRSSISEVAAAGGLGGHARRGVGAGGSRRRR